MTLIKWNPTYRPTLFNDIDRWLNNISSDFPAMLENRTFFKPSFEVIDTDSAYCLRADLPGMSKKDVSIEVSENVLTISGERKNGKSSKNSDHYSELRYGQFSRSFNLPEDIKTEGIKASMKDGVLALNIPRMEKIAPDVKKISIK
mgnify:CR=1 FL=1|tara:strand:- start:1025 stop:1462 length:438 start_codon:yes stop_codon:yes gene_type:complete